MLWPALRGALKHHSSPVNRISFRDIRLEPAPLAGLAPKVHRVLFVAFLAQWLLVWLRLWLPRPPFGEAGWPEGLLVLLSAATLLASLTTHLPGQNVLLSAVVIGLVSGGVMALGALTGVPFGPFAYTPAAGQQLCPGLPWAMPLVWLAALLASRGAARLALRPWRYNPNYGLWLIGLAALLVATLDLGLEPFATQVKHLWKWTPTRLRLEWYTAPVVTFVAWGVTALLILAFVTPALINKKPMRQPGPDFHPLVVWLLWNLLFATGAAVTRLWPALAVVSLTSVVVAAAGLYGAAAGPEERGGATPR